MSKLHRIWLPRVITDNNGKMIYTYTTEDGTLKDVYGDEMTLDWMCEFMASFVATQIIKMKESARLIKHTMKFDLKLPQHIEDSLMLNITLEKPDSVDMRRYTKDDLDDYDN